jgi:hypothetical protein
LSLTCAICQRWLALPSLRLAVSAAGCDGGEQAGNGDLGADGDRRPYRKRAILVL